jgi:hypothetical protein
MCIDNQLTNAIAERPRIKEVSLTQETGVGFPTPVFSLNAPD